MGILLHLRVSTIHAAQALVEFAFVVPVMLVLMLGSIDLGRAFVFGVSVQEGAREAARVTANASYDPTVTDAVVLGRLIASSNPALNGCSSVTTTQTCNGGTWTFSVRLVKAGTAYSSVAAARAANALPGAEVTVSAAGTVGLLPLLHMGAGLHLPEISVRGEAVMVVL